MFWKSKPRVFNAPVNEKILAIFKRQTQQLTFQQSLFWNIFWMSRWNSSDINFISKRSSCPSPCKHLLRAKEYVSFSLKATSKLKKKAIKIHVGANIEYVPKNYLLQMLESQLSHKVSAIHLSFSQGYFQSLKSHELWKLITKLMIH